MTARRSPKYKWMIAFDKVHNRLTRFALRRGIAPQAYAFLETTAGTSGMPIAAVATCRAILAAGRDEPSKAASLFADASTLWAGLPRPYDELLALEQQGRCLLGAGENERALALLSGVQERLGELGAKWDADRVAQLLRAHGVEVARSWRGGRRGYGDQLSPRELEVVALVARGLTSRQIGEALFLSPKTVDSHLRTAMRKMGVSTRSALAVAAAEAGLLISDIEDPGT